MAEVHKTVYVRVVTLYPPTGELISKDQPSLPRSRSQATPPEVTACDDDARDGDDAIEAMKQGAHDYLFKPLELGQLRKVVGEAVEVARRMREPAVVAESGDAVEGAIREIVPADDSHQFIHIHRMSEKMNGNNRLRTRCN